MPIARISLFRGTRYGRSFIRSLGCRRIDNSESLNTIYANSANANDPVNQANLTVNRSLCTLLPSSSNKIKVHDPIRTNIATVGHYPRLCSYALSLNNFGIPNRYFSSNVDSSSAARQVSISHVNRGFIKLNEECRIHAIPGTLVRIDARDLLLNGDRVKLRSIRIDHFPNGWKSEITVKTRAVSSTSPDHSPDFPFGISWSSLDPELNSRDLSVSSSSSSSSSSFSTPPSPSSSDARHAHEFHLPSSLRNEAAATAADPTAPMDASIDCSSSRADFGPHLLSNAKLAALGGRGSKNLGAWGRGGESRDAECFSDDKDCEKGSGRMRGEGRRVRRAGRQLEEEEDPTFNSRGGEGQLVQAEQRTRVAKEIELLLVAGPSEGERGGDEREKVAGAGRRFGSSIHTGTALSTTTLPPYPPLPNPPLSIIDLEISVPEKWISFWIQTDQGSVSVSRVIEASLVIETTGGDVDLGSIRAHHCDVSTSGGNITGGEVSGSVVDLATDGGDVTLRRFVCQRGVVSSGSSLLECEGMENDDDGEGKKRDGGKKHDVTPLEFESTAKEAKEDNTRKIEGRKGEEGGEKRLKKGAMKLGAVYGESLVVNTGGGSFVAGTLDCSESAEVSTEGGGIVVQSLEGRSVLDSRGGRIEVHVQDRAAAVEVRSGGGHVDLISSSLARVKVLDLSSGLRGDVEGFGKPLEIEESGYGDYLNAEVKGNSSNGGSGDGGGGGGGRDRSKNITSANSSDNNTMAAANNGKKSRPSYTKIVIGGASGLGGSIMGETEVERGPNSNGKEGGGAAAMGNRGSGGGATNKRGISKSTGDDDGEKAKGAGDGSAEAKTNDRTNKGVTNNNVTNNNVTNGDIDNPRAFGSAANGHGSSNDSGSAPLPPSAYPTASRNMVEIPREASYSVRRQSGIQAAACVVRLDTRVDPSNPESERGTWKLRELSWADAMKEKIQRQHAERRRQQEERDKIGL
eukprot:CAMPEP_0175079020 /NCGR_PEP_ID=MMETSP0052_2-20121109/24555_1 /TAXON_ID=51329 ORGANISM="Polytomella parva, Strain SAG 63-3" /NCGR_SAMPLE_ID=MMETSP0052_2 /ASSEMBLY_ACC=CAM_ASM_000194 /LENGTH=969 /DNA_ID=CAMNT_0016349233 /DNA_START=61 /DNA_END=2970 /DNA_ORIENTATION=+